MPNVDCKLIDCTKHTGQGTKCRGNVNIDEYGEPACYDPKPRSSLVHEHFSSGCGRGGRRYTTRVIRVLK